jgi:drug/metabolite transporter (DMT)-like permease
MARTAGSFRPEAGGWFIGCRHPFAPGQAGRAGRAISGLQLGACFTLAHGAVAWVPAGRTVILANTVWVVPLSLLILREHIPPRRLIETRNVAAATSQPLALQPMMAMLLPASARRPHRA